MSVSNERGRVPGSMIAQGSFGEYWCRDPAGPQSAEVENGKSPGPQNAQDVRKMCLGKNLSLAGVGAESGGVERETQAYNILQLRSCLLYCSDMCVVRDIFLEH